MLVFAIDALGAATAAEVAGERVVRRAMVPSAERPVGEVRLLRRGEVTVVQTLLNTKILKRVVAEIRSKEERNWPSGSDGHADMERYVAALIAAQEDIWHRVPNSERTADHRQRLLIEFTAGPNSSSVALAEFDADEVNGELHVTSERPISALDLSRAYITRNMAFIVADSFGVSAAEAEALVQGASVRGRGGGSNS